MRDETHARAAGADNLSQKYETIFCIFLAVAAFLYRDNPHLIYPQILYLLLALLSLNLCAGLVLRVLPAHSWLAALATMGNCAVITAIQAYSGGKDSNLWVLYLLPIYTACILLSGRQILLILLGVISFNTVFYDAPFPLWETSMFLNVALKTGVFSFAAAATWRIVMKDRRAREKLTAQRSDLQELESRFRESESALEESARMADVGQMAAGIAHDLNNPLAVVLGTTHVLLEEIELPVELRTDVERIERAAKLCRTIVANVLNVTREKEVPLSPGDMHEVIESALAIFKSSLNAAGVRVERQFSPSLPLLPMSAPHLERLLLNLMSNAKAAMPKGGVLTIRTVEMRAADPEGVSLVEVAVEDTGTGLPADTVINLFKPFNTTKAPGEGTGLGLYLSREIAMKHNGTLRAENRPEGGARFTLKIPVPRQQRAAA